MANKDQLSRKSFAALLADVKLRIQTAQTRAMLAVNSELTRLYWDIGRMIDVRQKLEGWGSGVIPQLATELKNEMPELKGFSERNIDRMIAFYRNYPDPTAILQQAVAKLGDETVCKLQPIDNQSDIISPQAVAKLGADAVWKSQLLDSQLDIILPQAAAKFGSTGIALLRQRKSSKSLLGWRVICARQRDAARNWG